MSLTTDTPVPVRDLARSCDRFRAPWTARAAGRLRLLAKTDRILAELANAAALAQRCTDLGLRAEIVGPERGSRGARIREARLVPYQAVIGAKEAADDHAALRLRDGHRLEPTACGVAAPTEAEMSTDRPSSRILRRARRRTSRARGAGPRPGSRRCRRRRAVRAGRVSAVVYRDVYLVNPQVHDVRKARSV